MNSFDFYLKNMSTGILHYFFSFMCSDGTIDGFRKAHAMV